jgi:hypothetical protein
MSRDQMWAHQEEGLEGKQLIHWQFQPVSFDHRSDHAERQKGRREAGKEGGRQEGNIK